MENTKNEASEDQTHTLGGFQISPIHYDNNETCDELCIVW